MFGNKDLSTVHSFLNDESIASDIWCFLSVSVSVSEQKIKTKDSTQQTLMSITVTLSLFRNKSHDAYFIFNKKCYLALFRLQEVYFEHLNLQSYP